MKAIADMIKETHINSINEVDSPCKQAVNQQRDVTLFVPLPSKLTDHRREKFAVLLSHYENVLAKCPENLGCTDVLSHSID